jgi:hypothetical protein
LVLPLPDSPELCRPDAFHEDMVHSTVRVELKWLIVHLGLVRE